MLDFSDGISHKIVCIYILLYIRCDKSMPVSGAPPMAGRLLQDLVQLAIYVVDLHAVRLRQQRDAVEHSLRNALLDENSIHQR